TDRDTQLAYDDKTAYAHPFACLHQVAGLERYAGANSAAVGALAVAFERDAKPVIDVVALVAQEPGLAAVLDEDHVEQPFVAEGAERAAAADQRLEDVMA